MPVVCDTWVFTFAYWRLMRSLEWRVKCPWFVTRGLTHLLNGVGAFVGRWSEMFVV